MQQLLLLLLLLLQLLLLLLLVILMLLLLLLLRLPLGGGGASVVSYAPALYYKPAARPSKVATFPCPWAPTEGEVVTDVATSLLPLGP